MKTNSFLSRLLQRLGNQASSQDARLAADALSYHPNLCQWLVTSVALAGKQGGGMLAHAAQFLRDELGDFVAAAQLDRMATEPALLRAVISELRTATPAQQPGLVPAL